MYSYLTEKPHLFTEQGSVMFLAIRDHAKKLLEISGAATMEKLMHVVHGSNSSWEMMACIDRMVELKEIREITEPNSCAGQNRVFVLAK